VQIRNSIFMDAGDNVVNNDVSDFENGNTGYGCNGTLTWAQRWTTSFAVTSPINPFANPAAAYTAHANGNLIDFRDNVFFNNVRAAAYTEATARSVFSGGNGTNNANNAQVANSPITSITRGAVTQLNASNRAKLVTFLDPTPANDALTSVEFAPADGFFTQARFRGAFPRGNNWLIGWSGVSAYGLTTSSKANVYIESERAGIVGMPVHYSTGTWAAGTPVSLVCDNVADLGGFSIGVQVFGSFPINFPIFGGLLVPSADAVNVVTGAAGSVALGPFTIPPGLSGLTFYTQWATFDPGVPNGEFAFSNAQSHILP
jgi:hypothetical protein